MADFIIDGNTTFVAGQDASKAADKVGEGAYYSGINVSTEFGSLTPRWGIEEVALEHRDESLEVSAYNEVPYEDLFSSGRFQASIPYSVGSQFYYLNVISGIIYATNVDTLETFVIPIDDGSRISEDHRRVNWSAAGRYLTIFDWPARPVILEGLEARRSSEENEEIPVSVLGAFNQNRLFIANAGNEFTAGDPVGSAATPDAPITFQEVLTSGSPYFGQVFQLNTNYNNDAITAMTFLQQIDTSTGIGPLLISTDRAIYSYQSQNPRADWETSRFGSLFTYPQGIAGQRAFTNVNADLFFMSPDGQVRTASVARSEQQKWSRIPISREVGNWLVVRDQSLVCYSVLSYHQNKIFVTCNPFRVPCKGIDGRPLLDVAFGGFAVLETDNIANLTAQAPPAWAGLWTGVRPMGLALVNDTLFITAKDGQSNKVYKFTPDRTVDLINGEYRNIRSRIYTREYNFKQENSLKSIRQFHAKIESIKGEFTFDVKYRPGHAANFVDWRTFKHNAPFETCGVPSSEEVNGFAGHEFRDFILGSPSEDACNEVSKDTYNDFHTMQLMLTITGRYWELDNLMISATVAPQNKTEALCEDRIDQDVVVSKQCSDDWAISGEDKCPVQT